MAEQIGLTDEYFINLTMDFDKRDEKIYPKWAYWCAKSNGKYYIDGKKGKFFTHERTDEEMAIEKKKEEVLNNIRNIKRHLTDEERDTNAWKEYEKYIHKLVLDKEELLNVDVKSYEDWKSENTK